MKISRRNLVQLAGAACVGPFGAIAPKFAMAAEFNYKFGNDLPADHPTGVYVQKAAERIKVETNGRLDIKVFPNNQLGSATDQMGQLRSGALEFMTQSGTILSTLVPAASIDGVGFSFAKESDVFAALDGALGDYIRQQIRKSNLVVMDRIWGHGFRHMTTSNRPIRTPEDFRGLKMRVPPTQLWNSMFRALGASPATINFNETYSALQTKVVDAQENPLALIDTAKMYEVQKYLSLTGHIWGGVWFLCNGRAFERLPPDVRDVVVKVINASAVEQRVELARSEALYRQRLADKGMIINETEPTAFRKALSDAGFYNEWRGKYGEEAWATLEKFTGKLA